MTNLLALSATCKLLRALIHGSPEAFRYLNLSSVKSAAIDASPIDKGGVSWRAERLDEALTEEDFFSGPLRGIFNKLNQRHVLQHVKTLVLDGLSVPAELIREVIAEPRFNIRILSIREVKNLNERKLQQVLHYAVRRSRPEGTPKLQVLYYFSRKEPSPPSKRDHVTAESHREPIPIGIMSSEGAQIGAQWNQRSEMALSSSLRHDEDNWYSTAGKIMKAPSAFWAETLHTCSGIIAFDVVLCRGPRHDPARTQASQLLPPAIATIALGSKGCEACGSCPEKLAVWGAHPAECFPVLTPPPTHNSTLHAAQCPLTVGTEDRSRSLLLRCEDCLRGRWCERCNKWWCEDCYQEPAYQTIPTELQQVELREELQRNGWDTVHSSTAGPPVKVFSNLCVESCLVGEILPVVDGMWG